MPPRVGSYFRNWGHMMDEWPCSWTAPYQDHATRELALSLGFLLVVPPHPKRRHPWEYDNSLYRLRNRIERLFRRIKAWRRVFTRYDKLDVMFAGSITVALIAEALR